MASAHSLSKLIKFIQRTEWGPALAEVIEEHLAHACHEHGVEPKEIFEILGEIPAVTLHVCALEDFLAREYAGGRNVVDEYLKRRGYSEGGGNRRYMQALRNSVMSLYEISDVVPGQSMLARDLIRDLEPVRVLEVSGTRTLKQWDRIGARIIRQGSEWRMAGGVLRFERHASDFLLEAFQRIDGKSSRDLRKLALERLGADAADLQDIDLSKTPRLAAMAPTFSGIWLADALDRALNPQVPELVNRDGDPIVFCTSRFPMLKGKGVAACRKALANARDLVEVDSELFNWIGPAGDPTAPSCPPATANAITLMTTSPQGDTIHGTIEIKRGFAVLSTNSRERAARGEQLVAAALAGLVGHHDRNEETASALFEAADKHGKRKQEPDDLPPEIARPIVHAQLDQHYRETLDRPMPALGHVSPREAARTDNGKTKVIDWLKDLENHAARAGDGSDLMAGYDFGWIWRELGVSELQA